VSLVFRHAVSRLRAGRMDNGHGGTEPDWATPDVVVIPGWAIDAGDTTLENTNREGTSVAYTIRGPMDADVRAGDRILWMGTTFDIDGDVVLQPGPSPTTSHCIIKLIRWAG